MSAADSLGPELRLQGPGRRINSVYSWFAEAPPKEGDKHWRDGRSALELARAWCRGKTPAMPVETADALDSHPDTAAFQSWDAIPELVTPLPEPGEGRNHDLVAIGVAGKVPTLISIEGKAGEGFGDRTIREYWNQKFGTTSRVCRRIAALVEVLVGAAVPIDREPAMPDQLLDRGYQLLTATAGAAIEARRRHCQRAVPMIHEFRVPAPPPRVAYGLAHSQSDFAALLAFLHPEAGTAIEPGVVVGPIQLPTTPLIPDGMPLYLGKCVTYL